ncbi:hypothetical protein [Lysobacter gummosus]|uniref:hypothetical protein n=1 Tax=Lysobacter gummosus TaxID=262324 RepID=UPI0036329BAC
MGRGPHPNPSPASGRGALSKKRACSPFSRLREKVPGEPAPAKAGADEGGSIRCAYA